MHCLEVIVARNERAVGREAAHAANDGNWERVFNISDTDLIHSENYNRAYERAREEK